MSTTTVVTIAQALASSAGNLHVVDSAADIAAALPDPALISRVRLFTLANAGTVSAPAAEKLAGLGAKFQLNGAVLTVRDTLAAMDSASNAAGVALAGVRQVADAAYNLLNASAGAFAHVTSTVLLGAPTLNVAQYQRLEALPGFSVDPSTHITLSDTLSAITALVAAHPAWLLPVSALTIKLDGSHIGAFTATQIATLEGHGTQVGFVASGANTTLPVIASAGDLAANEAALNHLAAQVTLAFTVSNPGGVVTAAQAVALNGLTGFAPAGFGLQVTDNGAALSANAAAIFGHGYDAILVDGGTLAASAADLLSGVLHFTAGGAAMLAASATLGAAQAAALLNLPSFSLANGATLDVADTIASLIAHAGGLNGASAIAVTDSETVPVASAEVLTLLAQAFGAAFSLGGHTITIADTAAALLALPAPVLALATATELSANATVTAAQFAQLRDTLHIGLNAHVLTVADSAAALLALSGSLNLAGACVLTGNAVVTAAQAAALAADPGFATGGHVLTVTDTAAALLALPASALAVASVEQLAPGAVTLTAAEAAGLAGLGHFVGAGAAITVTDTVANLTSPANAGWQSVANSTDVVDSAATLAANAGLAVVQNAATVSLSGNALVSVAQAAVLAGIPHFTTAGADLTVQGSAGSVAAAATALGSVATLVEVTDSGPVTAAQADALAALGGANKLAFLGGDALQVADSYAALTTIGNAAGLALAARLTVVDTGANLALAASHSWGAVNPSYNLSADSVVTAPQAAALAALGPYFNEQGHALAAEDTATALLALPTAAQALLSAEILSQTATIDAASFTALTARAGFAQAPQAVLIVQDNAAALLTVPAAQIALADTFQLDAGAIVSAAQFTGLRDTLHVDLNGNTLTVIDTAANLAALTGSLALATACIMSASATIDAAQAASLAAEPAFSTGGHSLIIADTAPALLALAPMARAVATSLVLASDQDVSAAQLTGLVALGGTFSVGSHVLAVSDTAAALAGLSAPALALASVEVLNTSATLTAVAAAALAALPSFFIASGVVLTVQDTAGNLLALNAPTRALAGAFTLSADATVSATQFATLRDMLHLVPDSHAITIADSAAGLLTLAGSPLTLATTEVLNADASVTTAQAQLLASEPGFSTGGYALTITGSAAALLALPAPVQALATTLALTTAQTVTAAQLSGLAELGHAFSAAGHALTVHDTAANLAALAAPAVALAASEILSQSDTVSAATANAVAALPSLTVPNGVALAVADSATGLLTLTPAALTLASAEMLNQSAAVDAATATALAALPHFTLQNGATLTVDDTAAALLALPAPVTAVATGYELSANATVSPGQFEALRDVLAVGLNGHALTISGSATDLVGLFGTDLSLATACVLNADATVSYWQANELAQEPGFSTNGHVLTVTDSAVNVVYGLSAAAQADATHLTLNGDQLVAPDQLQAIAALGTKFSANGHTITVEGSATDLLALTAPALALATAIIVDSPALLSAAAAASLVALGNVSLGNGVPLIVADTAAALLALPAGVTELATGTELTAHATVDAADFTTLRDTLDVAANGYTLTIVDSATHLLALAGSDLALADACVLNADAGVSVAQALSLAGEPSFSPGAHVLTITGSAATVMADLSQLEAAFGGFGCHIAITLSGGAPTLSVTASQYAADHAILDAVTNAGAVTVADTAANIAGLATSLQADAHVAQVGVSDSAVDVVENLSALLTLGAKLAVTLTDSTPLAASLVPFLVQLDNLTCPVGVSDTASQIAAVVEQADANNSSAAITFLEANGATLSGVSEVSVADLAALEQLGGSLNLNGNAIYVYDTAAHLTAAGAASALAIAEGDGLISGVYLKAPGGSLTMNATTALTLFNTEGVSTFYPPPQFGTIAVTVADTAVNIEAHVAALTALLNTADITGVQVSFSATITDSVLADLQALGAVTANGVNITVRDSAAAIVANAASQATGQSLTPSAWVLNGNATISEAQAASLGALSHFSAGGHTLTLNLNADLGISVADANALATIAGSLNLNSHALTVSGSVADLSGVTASAWSVVTPHLTDTLSNILALTASSPLLGNAVTVNDAESISVAQAETLFGLISADSGPGVQASHLDFAGHTETITGSVAQLQALTASAGWLNALSLHGAFALIGSDTVANLTNGANTSFLAGLAGTTLSADATVLASTAETLAGLEANINFSLGSHTLTVQDSAANLVAMQNAAGVALATTLMLSGPATVDAADAETLLANSHLVLTVPLTIIDSSANLMDGTLLADISSSGDASLIHIQLAGAETLDAETAASLVGLPGFSDTQHLTIADSSAYLLASANLSAEQQAVAVTLAGDETVSANTVLRLSEVPNFNVGDNLLTLAGNDFANAATLKAIADLGTNFSDGGHTITATQDALNLTPTEFTALQNDGVLASGHALSAILVNDSVTDLNNILSLSATGVAGATINVYTASGALLSATHEAQAGFTVTAPDTGAGGAFSITETVNGTESAPVVVLEASLIETAVSAAQVQFASSGMIEIDSGKYLNLYVAGDVPNNLAVPALVYNPAAHTISLDIPNALPVTLITLGAATTPASLDVSEILVKHHG
jgi:hypothetical protein